MIINEPTIQQGRKETDFNIYVLYNMQTNVFIYISG